MENVEVEGEPPATVTWTKNNKTLEKVENVKISQGINGIADPEYFTTIIIENAQRKQTGMYKIVAVNEHGQDEDEVEFVVLGPPGPPIGKCDHMIDYSRYMYGSILSDL